LFTIKHFGYKLRYCRSIARTALLINKETRTTSCKDLAFKIDFNTQGRKRNIEAICYGKQKFRNG